MSRRRHDPYYVPKHRVDPDAPEVHTTTRCTRPSEPKTEDWTRNEVERLSQVEEGWSDPYYVPRRVMSDHQWRKVSRFTDDLRKMNGKPVLYAVETGKIHEEGGLLGLGKYTTVNILLVVYADFVHRYAWRQYQEHSTKNLVRSDANARVLNAGGIPYEPVLYIEDLTQAPGYGPAYQIRAPGGDTKTADTFFALHLVAARREGYVSGSFTATGDKAWPLPPPLPAPATPVVGRPEPARRLVRDAREAELLAADWIRWMGFDDAHPTPVGADSGIDVIGTDVAAQVKFEAVKTGRPTLQALYGAGHALRSKYWIFFSSAGYTTQASDWAEGVGMALFRFALDGGIEPANSKAERMLHRTKITRTET